MAKGRAPKSWEATFAFWLIRALGGNTTNPYLLMAIIAWARKESGGSTWRGNNPLNVKRNGKRLTFSSPQAAATATAAILLRRRDFRAFVRRIREGTPANVKRRTINGKRETAAEATSRWMSEQAIDALMAIAYSKWDATGYGTYRLRHLTPTEQYYSNSLIPIWSNLTTHRLTIPAEPVARPPEPKPPKPPPVPKQPRTLAHIVPERLYLEPYVVATWYESRYDPTPLAPDAPIDGTW